MYLKSTVKRSAVISSLKHQNRGSSVLKHLITTHPPAGFVAYIDDTASWLTIAPAIIFLVGLCFVPPSPRYLTITGKPHTAKKLLLLHRFNTATVRTDVDVWLGSKDVFDVGRLFDDMKYVKLFSPLLGLSLLELKMGPVVFLFYLQEICFYICKSFLSIG